MQCSASECPHLEGFLDVPANQVWEPIRLPTMVQSFGGMGALDDEKLRCSGFGVSWRAWFLIGRSWARKDPVRARRNFAGIPQVLHSQTVASQAIANHHVMFVFVNSFQKLQPTTWTPIHTKPPITHRAPTPPVCAPPRCPTATTDWRFRTSEPRNPSVVLAL